MMARRKIVELATLGLVVWLTASITEAQNFGANFGISSQQLINQSVGTGFTSAQLMQNDINAGGVGATGSLNARRSPATASGTAGRAIKPFSNASRGPTVSPYLGLFNAGIIGDEIDNFQSFVQPQLRQQELNQQFRRQAQQINRQIQQQGQAMQNQAIIQEQRLNAQFQQALSQPAFNPTGSNQIMPTGHQTTFGFTGRYYPLRGR